MTFFSSEIFCVNKNNIVIMNSYNPSDNIFAIKIQAHWRSYKIRSKINIYKMLPHDLWILVLNNILYKHRYKKLILTYRNIYKNKCNILCTSCSYISPQKQYQLWIQNFRRYTNILRYLDRVYSSML